MIKRLMYLLFYIVWLPVCMPVIISAFIGIIPISAITWIIWGISFGNIIDRLIDFFIEICEFPDKIFKI